MNGRKQGRTNQPATNQPTRLVAWLVSTYAGLKCIRQLLKIQPQASFSYVPAIPFKTLALSHYFRVGIVCLHLCRFGNLLMKNVRLICTSNARLWKRGEGVRPEINWSHRKITYEVLPRDARGKI